VEVEREFANHEAQARPRSPASKCLQHQIIDKSTNQQEK
jgi:hypothetical protein